MDHQSLILGEIREFKRATLERLDKIEAKVEAAGHFRAKVIGIATLGAFLATALVELFRH